MSIEAEVSLVRENGPNKVLKSESIGANDSKEFDDPRLPARVFVICDLDGKGGAILIQDPKNVKVTFYKDEEDVGTPRNPKKPIRLNMGQEVVLWSRRKKRELSIYVDDSG